MSDIVVADETFDEIQQAFTEGEFNSRWALIETYHHVGTILNAIKVDKTQLLQHVAPRVGRSVRTLWYCVKFAEMYPDLSALPEGKNTSMRHIINNYLTTGKQDECLHPANHVEIISFEKCTDCGKHLGKVEDKKEPEQIEEGEVL